MYTYQYPHPAVTADTVVFDCSAGIPVSVLLIRRGNEPCKGCWAFPGGFMNIDEDAPACARRELKEESGLEVGTLVQVGAYTAVDRDPRERVITIAFAAVVEGRPQVCGNDDADEARWFPIDDLPTLAFDHAQIFNDALAKCKERFYFGSSFRG